MRKVLVLAALLAILPPAPATAQSATVSNPALAAPTLRLVRPVAAPVRAAGVQRPPRRIVAQVSPTPLPITRPARSASVRQVPLAAPVPVDAASIRRLSLESRVRTAPNLQALAAQSLATRGIAAIAPSGAGNAGAPVLAPRRTELAIADNPRPATFGQFPESGMLKSAAAVYAGESTTLSLLVRSSSLDKSAVPTRYLLQFASQPSGGEDWRKPAGLLMAQVAEVSPQSTPIGPYDAGAIPGLPKPPKTAAYARLPVAMPAPADRLGPAPTAVYLRVVPLATDVSSSRAAPGSVRLAVPQAAAPPSNWVRVDVPGTLAQLQEREAQRQAEAERARQEAELARQQAEAEARAKGLEIEIGNAKWNIDHAYEVEPLAYLPPKFGDDGVAPRMLRLSTGIDWTGGKGAFGWHAGESFEVAWALNLMDADRSPLAQMWDLAQGILSGLSAGYESAKNAVVDVVAGAISATGLAQCDAGCKGKLKTGLEAAIAWCGIPPKVPNVAQLYGQGADYLAANVANELVSQGVGVELPGGVATDIASAVARDQAREQLFKGTRQGVDTLLQQLGCPDPSTTDCGISMDNPWTWGVPDPYFRRHPGVLYVRVRVVQPQLLAGSTPVSIEVKADGAFATQSTLPLGYVPPQGVVVPIVLDPSSGSQWKVAGYMNDFSCDCGQPYYWNGNGAKISIATVHQVVSQTGNPPFVVRHDWTPVEFDGSFAQDFVDGSINNGYYGEDRPRWVYLP